ncbi:MAG: hypothetical protein H5T68_04985 [Chloroflexi bacterium]|nr:hypothetical protein [Chloroflexota bacterium]
MSRAAINRRSQWALALLVGLYAVLAASYFVLRYSGRWADSDTANLTVASAAVLREGTLVPTRGGYGLGFLYQATSAFIASLSGVDLPSLQSWVYPIVAAALSLMAFAMYRVLTGDGAAGALATLFLFVQPDFLFIIFRGSHEKTTWLTAMLAVFLLARSFRTLGYPVSFAIHVVLFYMAALALITSNAFFGSSFILAMVVSLVAGAVVPRAARRRLSDDRPASTVTRLLYVVAAAMVVWFLDLFYLYRPALGALVHLERALDKAAAVALGSEPKFDPYATVGWGWVSLPAYLGLILPSAIAGACSFILWITAGKQFWQGKSLWKDPPRFLLWLLYGGFGIQLALGIGLDQAGAIGGNLQQRFFPVVMMMAFPILARAIVQRWRKGSAWHNRLLAVGLCLFILWASGASLLKATNDPWLSNYWVYWTGPEDRAVKWIEAHLRYRSVWLGLDGIRLSSHAAADGFGNESGNERDQWTVNEDTRDILLSSVDKGVSVRRSVPLPDTRTEHRVYDNGTVAGYHLRPRTPYQH